MVFVAREKRDFYCVIELVWTVFVKSWAGGNEDTNTILC